MAKTKKGLTENAVVRKKSATLKNSVKSKHSAKEFISRLKEMQSDAELEKIKRYFKTGKGEYSENTKFIGVQMGKIFALAKEFISMETGETEKLLAHSAHEVKVGAVSIMDFQARDKKCTEERKKILFDLYIKQHKRINNWDLVDRSAPYVVGGYLYDKPRSILYKLATSKFIWERRTAIVATYFFIRQGQCDDTFRIAEILINDKEEIIQKATGSWIREAGGKDKNQLLRFLDRFAGTMPRVTLRYAIEKLPDKERHHYLNLKK